MINHKTTLAPSCFLVAAFVAVGVSSAGDDDWRVYSKQENGDVYLYDTSRVEEASGSYQVWSRVRYKTSVMGASSYQSLLELNCTERTERTLQRTFFSDRQWEKPAMKTDMQEKPKRPIANGSATERLFEILCS